MTRSAEIPGGGAGLRRSLLAHSAALERWFLPAECLLCQRPIAEVENDALVCALCRLRWRAIPDPLCPRCGQPILADLECRICPGWPGRLTRVRSAVWLEEGAREAVHQLKYGGWRRVAQAMATAMRRLEPLRTADRLVPVPLASRRLRRRGYNQSAELALALGRLTGLPVALDLLRRVRETSTQTALTPEARAANVAGAFAARGVAGRSLVLVDDVFTTGATLAAAAGALTEAGVARVEAVTFARAVLPVG